MKTVICSIISSLLLTHFAAAQIYQYSWDLNWINTKSYQAGLTKVNKIPEWRKGRYENHILYRPYMCDDQSTQIRHTDDNQYSIAMLDNNFSVIRQCLLPLEGGILPSPRIIEDGSCLLMGTYNLHDDTGGKTFSILQLKLISKW